MSTGGVIVLMLVLTRRSLLLVVLEAKKLRHEQALALMAMTSRFHGDVCDSVVGCLNWFERSEMIPKHYAKLNNL
ncbi:hypothetical protein J6590_103879 [Homalodisca vitripennis]|nr:hypothetical protein J6590_076839 [Homalodisca vitripennis]KAG8299320.1 hypothetical protein J6590_103879 [Homalodisca vitripennis]